MKLCTKLLAIFAIVLSGTLTSCSGPSSFSYQNVAITLTASPICNGCFAPYGFYYPINPAGAGGVTGAIEMPAGGGLGGCDQLQVTVTNAPLSPTWTILPAASTTTPGSTSGTTYPPGEPTANVGTLTQATTLGSNYYCGPNSAAIYTGASLVNARAAGIVDANGNVVQGTTEVVVTNPASPTDPTKVVSASLYFAFSTIGGGGAGPPTGVGVGMSGLTLPANVTVPLGTTYQFNGYVTGINGYNPCSGGAGAGTGPPSSTNLPAYGVTYTVNNGNNNGTGAGAYGTISPTGLYTAPTNYPSSTIKSSPIIVSSLACPTVQSAAVTVIFP